MYIDAISGAANYMYEIINLSSGSVIYYARGNYLTNLQLNWITGLSAGPTYSIRVATNVGGAWMPYGPACTVATGGASRYASDVAAENANAQTDRLQLVGKDEAKVYPNPNKGSFDLMLVNPAEVRISNLLGVNMYSGKLDAGIHAMDLNYIEPGVYLVHVYDGKNTWLMRKIKE